MIQCDHIVAVHIGHAIIRLSGLPDYLKENEGKFTDWCCGGGYLFIFCPTCGEKLVWKDMAVCECGMLYNPKYPDQHAADFHQ